MSDEVRPGFVRVRLDLSYDGTEFSGWAKQAGGRRTVQGEIEDALRTVTRSRETFELTVAGRTDAGVHARGQVAHVDLPREVWAEHHGKLLKRLAGRLPRDVRVWALREAPAGFDARFSAVWRRYAYRVTDNPGGVDPLLRGHVLWHDWPLDVDAMNEAARGLLGEHDFAAYCKKREGATTIRTLQELSLARGGDGIVTATVRADAFCHNMVRSLIGALLFVGDGHRAPDWPAKVLAAGVRDSAVHVVRPHGLTLEEVGYPADELLAARSREARNRRTLPGAAPGAGCC
ncbi:MULTISPECIES: tRNA pseudouridine(38-40) synthase TruA [Streptomyces]|uniref:tRNA pseudouridine synthase A n=2 Tax=Streptomyces griseoaurantiacus TaxID=68213 RepID=A0A1G7K8C2_9ACTN|nr:MULTISPECIES: tRNA pseudouridine(38-40) synthase TruA [Streptomyces]MBA5225265.1 tRNA pseudouridine(38-40) synthase TruA [Streptomyces griseoaurantiacus]MDX3089755.1 tRNA pseudouridine(38-40) synthase TruA [Streptomyces sp. ME12-02E]MDX3333221.1 tRNA pseudouridine(38-40) synthase TruA [Streptomyces sp. ME02-6978a]MDX3361571.1 tRNA pseudouridine(38-40) synthase TruA [Streptomyces sp. ME02-6978.2a]SDF33271.1 tRNA pseudouridine38-40 synthase [Streptomyces jietaisiensis]